MTVSVDEAIMWVKVGVFEARKNPLGDFDIVGPSNQLIGTIEKNDYDTALEKRRTEQEKGDKMMYR